MPHSGKLRWTARTLAIPLLISAAVHGLLLLALWLWPVRTGSSPSLAIQSTRITLDTCVLDSPPSALLAERELPPEVLRPDVDTTLAPQVEEISTPPPPKRIAPAAAVGRSGEPSRANGAASRAAPTGGGGNLFPLPAAASSVVYVLDHSLSMGDERKLDFACRELIASLRRLPASVRFQVIVYNDYAETLLWDGQRDLLPAESAIVAKAIARLQALEASGDSKHVAALCRGLNPRPDVLYFLTDADDLKPREIAAITQRNQRTVVHTIELTHRRSSSPDDPLVRLARDNRGTYRRVSPGG